MTIKKLENIDFFSFSFIMCPHISEIYLELSNFKNLTFKESLLLYQDDFVYLCFVR